MATATQRISVPVAAAERKQLATVAKNAGLSVAECMRRAAAAFRVSEDERVLEGMIEQMLKTTEQANQAIGKALEFVEASNRRIADLEAKRKTVR